MPTVAKACPEPIASSHCRALGLSAAFISRRTAASCCERMKTAVSDPSASRAYRCTSSGLGQAAPPNSVSSDQRVAPAC